MTDEEKLLLEADIARNKAEAAQAELATTERRVSLEEMRGRASQQAGAGGVPSPDQSAQHAARQQQKAMAAAAHAAAAERAAATPITDDQRRQIREAAEWLWGDQAISQILQLLVSEFGVSSLPELTETAAMGVMSRLLGMKSDKQQAENIAMLEAAGGAYVNPAAVPNASGVAVRCNGWIDSPRV